MELEFDLKDNKKFGNKTVKMSSKELEAEIEFENDIEDQVVYGRKGSDIVITAYAQNGGKVDTTKVLGTVTIKNAGLEEVVKEGSLILETDTYKEINLLKQPYSIGDGNTKKKQTVKGTFLNEEIYGGYGNDTLYGVGGENIIVGGEGADKMYAGAEVDYFVVNKGDAINGDTIYNADSNDNLLFDYTGTSKEDVGTSFEKAGDDLIVNTTKGDFVTLNKFFTAEDPIDGFTVNYSDALDKYEFGDSAILVNGVATDHHIAQIGNAKKANTLVGTKYIDMIWGGDKADKITTGNGDDFVEANKGNDTIVIDGYGHKEIAIFKGDGNDTVIFESAEPEYKGWATTANLNFADSEDATFSFKKDLTDLTITATHKDKSTESITIKNYYDPLGGTPVGVAGATTINDELASDKLAAATTTIAGRKVSDILKYVEAEYGIVLPAGIKIPSALGSVNVFAGSQFNDEFKGTTGKDVMVSFGGNNEFTTGAKGQTVMGSIGAGHDTYNVTSFTAGTVIADADGDYDLTINGVDTNDIHMVGGKNILGSVGATYMTDKTGISNLAGIDYKGLYEKIMVAVEAVQEKGISDKETIKDINAALNAVPGLINKFRGVAIADDFAGALGIEEKGLGTPAYDDMTVVDKKGNKQTISGNDIALLSQLTSSAYNEYLYYINEKYADESFGGFDSILEVVGYLLNPKDGAKLNTKEQKMYNDIKKGFFDTFKQLYIGTTGDESYTITKAEGENAYVSGAGSDSFTFKGDIGTKWTYGGSDDVYRSSNYRIMSTYEAGQKDSITFTGYSFDNGTLYSYSDYSNTEDGVVLRSIDFDAYKFSKNGYSSAYVSYYVNADANSYDNSGYNLKDGEFNLALKDSKRAYDYTAAYDQDKLEYKWSGTKTNNILHTFTKDLTITSNSGYNSIYATATQATSADNRASVNYTYGGGDDYVLSNSDYSDDTYTLTLDKNTALSIDDDGRYDNDQLLATATKLNDVRLFVNIHNDGDADYYNVHLSQIGDLKKSSFTISSSSSILSAKASSSSSYKYAYFDKGVGFDYDNTGETWGIENVSINKKDIDVNAAIDKLRGDVQAWFTASSKDYYDVNDVIANGTKTEVNQILAIYNNLDLSNYQMVVS